MNRILKYDVYADNKKLGPVYAATYESAVQEAYEEYQDKFRGHLIVDLVEDPETIMYLIDRCIELAKSGASGFDLIEPYASAAFSFDPRETHYMNVVDRLPAPVNVAFLQANEDYDTLENLDPWEKIIPYSGRNVNLNSDSTSKQVDAKWIPILSQLTDSIYLNGYDKAHILESLLDRVDHSKFSNSIIKYIQYIVLKTDMLKDYNVDARELVEKLPTQTFSKSFMMALLHNNSNMIFWFPQSVVTSEVFAKSLDKEIKNRLRKHGQWEISLDELEDYIKPEILQNPMIQGLVAKLQKIVDDERAEWERGAPAREAARLQAQKQRLEKMQAEVKRDGLAIHDVPEQYRTDELINIALNSNPRAIFHLKPEQRTKERWIQVTHQMPQLLDLVRPLSLRDEIQQMMTADGDLSRMRDLAGIQNNTQTT